MIYVNLLYFKKVASDASDYEDDSHVEVSGKVTMNMVDAWEKELNSNKYVGI